MDSMQRLMEETKTNSLDVGFTYTVYVTHINNPHSFYVRPRTYNKYMSTVQARGDRINKSEIKVGSIVVFKSQLSKDYVRGKVLFIEGEEDVTCDLFALDIGYVENCVPLQKIWKPYYQVNLPPLAFHCQLGHCIPRTEKWHESTIEAMKGFVRGDVAKIKIKNIMPEVVIVELEVSCPDDLATLLAITRHTSYGYIDDLDYQLTVFCTISNHLYPERVLQVKSVLNVRMLSGSFLDKFYAAQVEEYKTYLEVRNDYTAHAATERSISCDDLKLNEPVGVFYHRTEKYERGLVREILPNKNKAKVELVDWGKIIEEPVQFMRRIPEKYLCNPPIAIYCGLHISQYSTTKLSEISNLANFSYPGVEFTMKIEEVGNDDSPTLVTVSGIRK